MYLDIKYRTVSRWLQDLRVLHSREAIGMFNARLKFCLHDVSLLKWQLKTFVEIQAMKKQTLDSVDATPAKNLASVDNGRKPNGRREISQFSSSATILVLFIPANPWVLIIVIENFLRMAPKTQLCGKQRNGFSTQWDAFFGIQKVREVENCIYLFDDSCNQRYWRKMCQSSSSLPS